MFIITQHQYEIIMNQVQACYPQETGGFLGGKEDKILGVLPVPNKVVGGRDEFGLWDEDFSRAHLFFNKHDLRLMGVYHSHPAGIALPSDQDIRATLQKNMRFMFIIGLSDRYKPDLRAYSLERGVKEVPIKVVSDKGVTVLDLFSSKDREKRLTPEILHTYHDYVKRIILEQTEAGKKMDFGWDSSTFETMA